MHDVTADQGRAGGVTPPTYLTRWHRAYSPLPTIACLRRHAPRSAALRVRILRHRRRATTSASAQLGGARRRRARAALRRHQRAAAGRRRAVRPPLRGADRRRADGRPVARLAGRRRVSGAGRAARAACPTRSAWSGGATIEEVAALAPDVFWFQLYRIAHERPRDRLRSGAAREGGGRHVLVLTIDVPVRTTRPREVCAASAASSGRTCACSWKCCCARLALALMLRNGYPRFATLRAMPATNAEHQRR